MVARTPHARVRGLGAAGSGTREYWLMTLSGVALVPLIIFLAGVLIALRGADHAHVSAVLTAPYIALPLILFAVCNALHMRLGMQNIIDDYVHSTTMKKIAVAANLLFSYGLAAAALYFLILIGLRG